MTTRDAQPDLEDRFEAMLRQGLDHIASTTPVPPPGAFDPDVVPITNAVAIAPGRHHRRWRPVVVSAAAAAVVVVGLVALQGSDDAVEEPVGTSPATSPMSTPATDPIATAATTAPATVSTLPEAVRGEPTCGSALPVDLELSPASTPAPGPAVPGPTADGQYAHHWIVPTGIVEVRWPADPRELYGVAQGLEQPPLRGDASAFDSISASFGGGELTVSVPNLGVELSLPTEPIAGLVAPCDVLQVRFVDAAGNQTTKGYVLTDLTGEFSFGIDLDPLVTSITRGTAPDPDTVVACSDDPTARTDTTVAGPSAATPAEALLAFLRSDQAPSLISSGYEEWLPSDDEAVYTILLDGRLVTHVTVVRTQDGWSATRVVAPGC